MKVSAVLIVKDEAPIIAQCLDSINDFDEIVVVDTGSTDGTQDICRSFGAKVYEDYQWNDDFAEARNHAISKATGDWLFLHSIRPCAEDPQRIAGRRGCRKGRKQTVMGSSQRRPVGHLALEETAVQERPGCIGKSRA